MVYPPTLNSSCSWYTVTHFPMLYFHLFSLWQASLWENQTKVTFEQCRACLLKMYSSSLFPLLVYYFTVDFLPTSSSVAHVLDGPSCARPPDTLVGPVHNRALSLNGRLTWLTSVLEWPWPPRPCHAQYNASVSVPDSSGPERYVPKLLPLTAWLQVNKEKKMIINIHPASCQDTYCIFQLPVLTVC